MDAVNHVGVDNHPQNIQQPSARTYNFLLRMSRVMGGIATHSSFMHELQSSAAGNEIRPSARNRWLGFLQSHSKPQNEHEKNKNDKVADLKKIVSQSHEILMSANTVFPITLFPDTVTVDRTKVTITRRDFFWSSDVMSIRIEDVLNVAANVGPLFGSLTIASRVMSTVDHFKINHFWRSDAIRLKHMIQGYVIAQHNKIDTAHLSRKDLIDTIIELGHDSAN